MKRTKGSQSELGMLYQYGVTVLLAAELSANDEVEDYVLYSSEESAGKFDDLIARIKLKQEADWYLSLIQVKYKETKKLNVSDVLKGKTIEYFLSDYIRSFDTIMSNEAVACRYGIPSEHIRVAIFCDKDIQTPVYLRKECTFLINSDRYTAKQDISNTILPFGGKCWKFSSKDLEHTEYQRFLNGCYLYLEQPNHSKLNKHIQKVCGITSAKDVINYVKDYFNNDFLYQQGLRKEVFEVELQKLRFCDMILPPISFVDLSEDNRIDIWNKIILAHDVTVIYNEDSDILHCLHSCLVHCINKLLEIDVDWTEYVYPSRELENDIIKKFIAYSKTKPLRYWISAPNTIRSLLLELWKCNAVPLILKTNEDIDSFEKYVHLARSYILIRDVTSRLQNVSSSKVKVFTCVNDIVNLQLRNSMLSNTLVSFQGRRKQPLMEILNDDNELMKAFSSADIIGLMKKRTMSLRDDYLKSIKYAAFIIENDKYTDTVMPPDPYVIGSSIKIYCPSNKVQKCIEALETHERYRDYVVYHLRWAHNFLEIVQGDKSVLSNCFMDQYGESLHVAETGDTAVIIGTVVMPEELQRLHRYVKRATILPSIFNSQQKQICLVSGDLDTSTENITCTSDSIEHLVFTEEKTYFIKISTEEYQDIWLKLCDLGFPIFHVKVEERRIELLRYSHCKNISSYISYDGKRIPEDQFFEEVSMNAKGITVVAGEPGMGKTSLLKSLYNHSYTRKYTVFYDLKDFQSHLRRHCMTNPLEFIFNEFHKGLSKTYKKLLRGFLRSRRLILLLDSFDEVRSACEKQLLKFIRALADSGINMIIATRLEGCSALIDAFSVEAVKLEPLLDDKKAEYSAYWKLNSDVLTNIPSELITNPLYLNFLRIISENQEKLSQITKKTLYEKVIHMKIVRWLRSNNRIVRDSDVAEAMSLFERLALVAMFGKQTVEEELMWICDETMLDYTKFGIITHFDEDNSPIFCHRSFIEFLVAQWLVNAKEITIYKRFAKYVYRRLFIEGKLNVLNILSEDLVLHRTVFSEDSMKMKHVLETDSKSLGSSDSLGRTALHIAVICCKRSSPPYHIVELIIKCMLRNYCDMNQRDSIIGWNWTDYIQAEIFEYTWFCRSIATIKLYLHLQREKLDKFDILSDSFPFKYFFEIFRWATETSNFTIIRDLLVLQYYQNKQFRKFYHEFLNSAVNPMCHQSLELDMAITAIHIATIFACIPMIYHLIKIGVDLNAIDGFACTPLHYSIMGYLSANTRHQPRDGSTDSRFNAIDDTRVYFSIIDILLEAGANCNVHYAFRRTSLLHFAVQTENVNIVESMVKFNATVNFQSHDGNTALHAAAQYGVVNIVECLLNHGADANLMNAKGETARDVAVSQANTDIVNLLPPIDAIEKNILVKVLDGKEYIPNIVDGKDSGETPTCLHSAAQIGDIDIVRYLIESGENINARNIYGCTPLRIAARRGHVDVAKLLIEKGGIVNRQDKFNMSPLHSATWQENPMILQLLLQNGANVNSVDYFGKTPLHQAVMHNSFQFVKILLEGGADANSKCKQNNTPLHWATANGDEDIVQILLEKGAELHTCDIVGYTAIHYAIERKHINIVRLLLGKGAHKNDYTRSGYIGLHLAILAESADILRLLLKEEVDANAQCVPNGYTSLHLAVIKQYTELVGILLANGVNVNVECKSGYTPFFIAVREKDINIVRLFLEYKGKLNIDDKSILTVIQRAADEGDPYLTELLLRRGIVINH